MGTCLLELQLISMKPALPLPFTTGNLQIKVINASLNKKVNDPFVSIEFSG